ncbi:HTH-type transcriptional repressor YcgE [Salinivirga cyanobacteriivorans]|uniref:HTH-type transcriptional repressor YcgE n=1 Tax=Salinivirga cyanobacteriivorans TaxID=1307839 RepID=A0A0S2I3I2_9BACT|nr:MerR family transcriptional regulator [Salinivirga cyanobacteriivorans]ALO16775.1 HTH-type transcriptional repressor YcgE [Salinivirga cyanobacteriivorans]
MYSIKDLERLTGIKAHTIRMWEKRYGIIEPKRTETNIRTYCDTDVKKLLNIAVLNKHGLRISKLAGLSDQELREKVVSLNVGLNTSSVQIEHLIISMIDMDEIKFESVLNRSIIKNGFEETVKTLLFPFFDRIGVLWQTGSISPAQEHFVSNLVRQKLFVATDRIVPESNVKTPTFVFFLHDHELHEIGLLFYHYIAKKWGMKTLYLGQIVPFDDLKEVHKKVKPQYLFTSFTASMDEGWIENYIKELTAEFSDATVYISGYQVKEMVDLPKNVQMVKDIEDFKEIVKEIVN